MRCFKLLVQFFRLSPMFCGTGGPCCLRFFSSQTFWARMKLL